MVLFVSRHARGSQQDRERRYKSRNFAVECQRARREATLERQRASRRDLTETLRNLTRTPKEPTGDVRSGMKSGRRGRKGQGQGLASLGRGFKPWRQAPLAMPEWLLEVPERLSTDWYVIPRVDGKRCIVVAHNGSTTIRSRHGAFLRRGGPFSSPLPGGSRSTCSGGKGGMTVLDCIYPQQDLRGGRKERLYVLDVMMWNGKDMYDCSAEFRFFWLQSTLNDVLAMYEDDDHDIVTTYPVQFQVLPYFDADREGILAACDADACNLEDVKLDGLLFYLKQGPYMLGVTPLILIWKDGATSYHFIETVPEPPPENVPAEKLPLVVSLCGRKTEHDTVELLTSDNPPISLGEVDLMNDVNEENGRLLRFKVLDTQSVSKGDADLQLEYVEKAGKSRVQPDSWSRIEFQCRARHCPLTLDEILHAASGNI